ncbi:drug/metabolite transporter (DMT)-like permease [Azospirillum agricola]|uniref:DMT family transporter n=1 Tax=Azospirillum agricola TaxID=1720247 RepID=UPI001AE7AA66|nr:DMT family transporter [Azospirillum agricola]MBP2230107.1 drug/metabolite transporter (DMT)-like permease [Azospirillum agricola]
MTSLTIHGVAHTRDHAALLSLIAGALAIALSPILARVSELEPVATAFYRLIVALPFFWLGTFAEGRGGGRSRPPRQLRPLSRADALLMGAAGLMLAGDLALWHLSITMTSVANATLFNNCAPVFVALFGWLLFRERVGGTLVAALAVALSGMALLIGDGLVAAPGAVPGGGEWRWAGDAVAVVTGAFYAGYLLIVKRLRAAHSTSRIMLGTSAAAAVFLLGAALLEGGPLLPQGPWGWGVVLALGIVCHVFGQGAITHALARLPVTFSSIGLLLQPIAAAALAWLLFDEALGPLQWAGGGLVLFGIVLARRAPAG